MSDTEQPEKLKRITFKTEIGSKWFDDPAKLLTWVQKQRALYTYHANVSNRYGVHQFFNQFDASWNSLQQQITGGLQRFQNDPTNYNNRAIQFGNEFEKYLNSNQLYTEDAPFSDFIARQSKKKPEYAVAGIAVIFEFNLTPIDSYVLEGIKEAKLYLSGNDEREKDELNKLGEIRTRWDTELHDCRNNWVSKYSSEVNEAKKLNNEAESLISDWQKQTETQTEELENSKISFLDKFDSSFQSANEELERITSTYDAKLALHASVRYWGIQQKQHQKKTIGYGIVLGISVVAVVIGLIVFSSNFLDQSIKDIHISRLMSAAVLTSFSFWLIKILSNIFMSHMHLATDAQERRTMIHTYLALNRKGQGPKEEDRQLILQTLFRPSTDGMIKGDAGPTHLVDMVNRLSTKKTS